MFAIGREDNTRERSRRLAIALAGAALAALGACGPSDPGERVFTRKCAGCHGGDGLGRGRYPRSNPAVNLVDGVWTHGPDRAAIRRLVADGDPKSPMPPFRGRLTEAEIDAVVSYVEALAASRSRAPHPARP